MSQFSCRDHLKTMSNTPHSKTSSSLKDMSPKNLKLDTDHSNQRRSNILQPQSIFFGQKEWSFYWIDNEQDCDQVIPILNQAHRYYIDTEFQTVRNHSPILSLLQISIGERLFVIDCHQLGPYDPLTQSLSRRHVEWVLHDGRVDIPLLYDFFGIPVPDLIFDTQIAWGFQHSAGQIGLALLTQIQLGVTPDKTFQTAEFLRRPLPQSWIEYAASDLPPLIELYPILSAPLSSEYKEGIYEMSMERIMNRIVKTQSNSSTQSSSKSLLSSSNYIKVNSPLKSTLRTPPSDPKFYEDLYSFRTSLCTLNPHQLQCLRTLLFWKKEQEPDSEISRRFPHSKKWTKIARTCPRKIEDLKGVPGLSPSWIKTYGSTLIIKLNEALIGVPSSWVSDPTHPWSKQYKAAPILLYTTQVDLIEAGFLFLLKQCSAQLKISSAYLLEHKELKKLNPWPDIWCTPNARPSNESIWKYIEGSIPILSEGWRLNLLKPLLEKKMKTYSFFD